MILKAPALNVLIFLYYACIAFVVLVAIAYIWAVVEIIKEWWENGKH